MPFLRKQKKNAARRKEKWEARPASPDFQFFFTLRSVLLLSSYMAMTPINTDAREVTARSSNTAHSPILMGHMLSESTNSDRRLKKCLSPIPL